MGKTRTGPKHVQSKFPPEKTSSSLEPETPDLDVSTVLVLPEHVLESGTVDQTNFASVLGTISKLESIVETHRKLISPNFPKFLSFCLNFLELEVVKTDTASSSSTDLSSSLNPIHLVVKLRPRESIELKMR
jgi:hypothetical protein